MEKPPRRVTKLIYIHKNNLIFTSVIDTKKVNKIAKEFKPELYQPSIGYMKDCKVIITDGNHRAKALIKRGSDYIPFGLLKEDEYDWVKYSNRTFDIVIFMPDKPVLYPMYYIQWKVGDLYKKSTSFPLLNDPGEEHKKEILEIAMPKMLEDPKFAAMVEKWGIAETEIIRDDAILTS